MPFKKTKVDGYKVTSPGKVHAKGTTKEKAEAQIRLLHGVESGEWKPTGKPAKSKRKTGSHGELGHETGHSPGIGKSKMSTHHGGEHVCRE